MFSAVETVRGGACGSLLFGMTPLAAEAFRPDRHPIIREKRRGSIGYFRLFY